MTKIEIESRAKINLTLDVLYKRPDGYHEVEMILQSIALKDHLTIQLLPNKTISVKTNNPLLADNEDNLAYKAAKLMMDEFKLDAGVDIKIHKNIPVAAGLAGGSSNAAAVILAINDLFELKKTREELAKSGKKIGADVPFCIWGGTALASGIGERLKVLKSLPRKSPYCFIKPPYNVSTKQVYSRLNVKTIKQRPDTGKITQAIEQGNVHDMAKGLCNVLEEVTFTLYPELADIKGKLKQHGPLGSLMSGSGPTVFGIYESRKEALKVFEQMYYKNHFLMVSEVD